MTEASGDFNKDVRNFALCVLLVIVGGLVYSSTFASPTPATSR